MTFPPLFYIKSFLGKLKKVALVFIVFYIVIQLFFYFWTKDTPRAPVSKVPIYRSEIFNTLNDPQLNKTPEGKSILHTYRGMMCIMLGEACTNNLSDADINNGGGVIGMLSSAIAVPYAHPPASGIQATYVALQNADFVPRTYAAEGIGYAALAPIRPIWLVFRNLVFLFMILIVIAVGFMIMFRAKINPQTVISIETALPKIVIALILITFSYAIAGFLIDAMYIIMGVVVGVFGSNKAINFNPGEMLNVALYGNSSTLLSSMFDNNIPALSVAIYNVIPEEVQNILKGVVGLFTSKLIILALGAGSKFFLNKFPIGPGLVAKDTALARSEAALQATDGKFSTVFKTLGTAASTLLNVADNTEKSGQPIVSFIAALVVIILQILLPILLSEILTQWIIWAILMLSLLFIYFRLFFMFISVYVQILILIMFSPAILALEAIPGRSAFAEWIKSLLVHLSTFPLFLILLLASKAIISQPAGGTLWKPPFTYGFPGDAFNTIIAMALIYMAPEFIKMFKEMTGVKPMAASLNLGAFFSGATVAIGGGLGLAGQLHSLQSTLFGYNATQKGLLGGSKVGESLSKNPIIGRFMGSNSADHK